MMNNRYVEFLQYDKGYFAEMFQVERVRLFLRLRNKLKSGKKVGEENDIKTPLSPTIPKYPIPTTCKLTEKEAGLAQKVLRLIKQRIPINKEPPTGKVAFYLVSGLLNIILLISIFLSQ